MITRISKTPSPLPPPRRRRGTAEIELLLAMPLLIAVLLIAVAAFKLGVARVENVFSAESHAYSDVTRGGTVTDLPTDTVIEFTDQTLPPLPDRLDEATAQTTRSLKIGSASLPDVKLTDRAAFLDPEWHYAAFPVQQGIGSDRAALQEWFEAYVNRDPSVAQGLGLDPVWPP